MRRVLARVAYVAVFALSSRARAADEWTGTPIPADHATPSFGVALGGTYVDYQETLPAPVKSRETGVMPGARLAGALALPNRLLLRATFAFGYGKTHYTGTTQTGIPLEGDHDNLLVEPEADIGYRFTRGDALRAGFYAGVGFRYWRRDLSALPSGGYLEEYELWEAPIGLLLDSGTTRRFTVGLDLAIVPTFGGRVRAHFSGVGAGLADLDLPVGDALGVRAAVPLTWRFDGWRLFAAPEYRYLPLDAGSRVILRDTTGAPVTDQNGNLYVAHEPESRAHLVTLEVGVGL